MHMKPNRFAVFFGAVALSCLGAVAGEVLRLEPSRSASISTALVSTNGKVLAINGDPVNVDTSQLRQWANRGDAEAQFRLARYLDLGKHGLKKDRVEAYKWAKLSSNQGHAEASNFVKGIELFLSTSQLVAAQAAVSG